MAFGVPTTHTTHALDCERCERPTPVLPDTVSVVCTPCVRQLVEDGSADPQWLTQAEQASEFNLDAIPDAPEVADL